MGKEEDLLNAISDNNRSRFDELMECFQRSDLHFAITHRGTPLAEAARNANIHALEVLKGIAQWDEAGHIALANEILM